MLSENANNAARYMRLTALFLFSHAALLILEGGWMILNHRSHLPHYHNHHVHDACHSLAIVLGALLCFYTIIVLLIVLTKYVAQKSRITVFGRTHGSTSLIFSL
jgi:TRAP-type C4-dicarboxylate transport system permease small subunit